MKTTCKFVGFTRKQHFCSDDQYPKTSWGFCIRMWSCQIFGLASSFTIFVQCLQNLMLVLLFLENINCLYILNRYSFSILIQLQLPLRNPHSLYYQLQWDIREHSRLFLLVPNFSLLQLTMPINKIINPITSLTYFFSYVAMIQYNVKSHTDKEVLNTVG